MGVERKARSGSLCMKEVWIWTPRYEGRGLRVGCVGVRKKLAGVWTEEPRLGVQLS